MYRIILIVIFSLALFGCDVEPKNKQCATSSQISQVSFKRQMDNVLRYDISYQLSDSLESFIKFWETDNPSNSKFIKVSSGREANTTLYGVKANTEYKLQIVFGKECENGSDIISFKTGNLPYKELKNFELTKNGNEFNGHIMFHQSVGTKGQLHVIVDDESQVVWYQYSNKAVNTFSWTKDRTIVALLNKDQLIEVDLFGNEKFSLKFGEKGFDKKMHHEIQKDDAGHIYGLTYENKVLNEEERSKYGVDTLRCDGILVFDSVGNKFWEWSMFQVEMPPLNSLTKKAPNDWGHANALYDDKKGNYLISFRNFSQIWSVNKKDGGINWKFGENSNFIFEPEDVFHVQHAVHINKNGNMMLFDNGDRKRGVSRALSFNVDAENNHYEKNLDVRLPKEFYSSKKGNAQLISDEYVMFNSTMASTITVSKINDSTIWVLKLPQATYRAEHIDNLYD